MPLFLISASLTIFFLVWTVVTYNSFIREKNLIKEAWSGIDVQLKRRYNLIPNLVETVKGYSSHEKNLFENITNLRSRSTELKPIGDTAKTESELTGMLKNLFAVAEGYPDLKASQNFLDLQKQLSEIEEQIQYARRYYNGTVRDYNISVESVPSNFVAVIFKFKQEQFFEIALVTEKEIPEVKFA
jgi:LemA protein